MKRIVFALTSGAFSKMAGEGDGVATVASSLNEKRKKSKKLIDKGVRFLSSTARWFMKRLPAATR
jgi:hypothetical protein